VKVSRDVKTMHVIKKYMYQYKRLLGNCLPICIKADFQQRIEEKYKRSLIYHLVLPNLYFFRNHRYANRLNQKIPMPSPVHTTVITSVLKSQSIVRETVRHDKIVYVQGTKGKTNIILTTFHKSWSPSGIKIHQNRGVGKPSSIEWHNIRQPLSLKGIQIIPVAMIAERNASRPSFSKMEILADRSDESNGYVRIKKAGGPPSVTQHEGPVIIHKARRPLELSYLPAAVAPPTKPVFQLGRENAESAASERPQVGIHHPPKPSHAGSLDLNLLTDQVYQVLERKIRLEKQRRGYR
jgi:hypothetical protein